METWPPNRSRGVSHKDVEIMLREIVLFQIAFNVFIGFAFLLKCPRRFDSSVKGKEIDIGTANVTTEMGSGNQQRSCKRFLIVWWAERQIFHTSKPVPTKGSTTTWPCSICARLAIIIDNRGSMLVFPMKCLVFREYFETAHLSLSEIYLKKWKYF